MIIPLDSTKLKPAAEMMARAFFYDPYDTFVIPDLTRRERLLPWLFERLLRYGQRYGRVFTTDSIEGAAMWLGPEKPDFHLPGAIWTRLALLPLKLSRAENARIQVLDGAADRLHAEAVTGPHWYLPVLGVDPAFQGQGIGGALLQPVLELADRDQQACYLDTNNEKNLPFYERHGFRVAGQLRPDPDGPSVWGLVRNGK